jgi:hypothetical protein
MPNFNVPLSQDVLTIVEHEAQKRKLRSSDFASRLIEDRLKELNLLTDDLAADIDLARSLLDRAIQEAMRIVSEEEFRSSITFDTIQSLSNDADWLGDYAKLVRDDPYKTGNPLKQTINQNLGYYIKKTVGAKSMLADGKPVNVKVKGSIIQSYTRLELA